MTTRRAAPTRQEAPSVDRTSVVFVAGYARSGSTVLDRMLGSTEGWVSAGELRFIWERGFAQDQLCSCGERFRACAFWRAVADEAYGGMERVDVARVLSWQRRFDQWWRIVALRRAASGHLHPDLAAFTSFVGALYPAIARVARAGVVVDSSKDASYGYVLQAIPSVDLSVVHLVRDPRAVAYSLCERRKFDPGSGRMLGGHTTGRAISGWAGTNILAEPLGRREGRRLLVRYERFAEDPETVVREIRGLAGDPEAGIRTVEPEGRHQVAGNPVRFDRGSITVRRDDVWRERMTTRRRLAVSVTTWPLRILYEHR